MPGEQRLVLVVGYDGHTHAAGTLRFAAEFATRLDARLQVVHVVDLDDYPVDPDSAFWEDKAAETVDRERSAASATLSDWNGEWSYNVERGDPVQALTHVAEQQSALLIVVGAHAKGFLRQFMSGDRPVADQLSDSRFPVLVAPADHNPG